MTTRDGEPTLARHEAEAKLAALNGNLARIEELSQRMAAALARRKVADPALQGPGQEVFLKAAAAFVAEMMANPSRLIEHQVGYWGRALKHHVEAQQRLLRGELKPPADTGPSDKRFANPLWDTHPFFNYLKQTYLLNAQAITGAVGTLERLDAADRKRVDYFTRQIVDMFAPTNFLATNPEALERAVATDGESLVQGMENLVRDIEANEGDLVVTLADRQAFRVGVNLATTPGAVVFRNRMMELIQYAPATETVFRVPVVIFPPWINKYYILDLKPQNSLVKWLTDQGFTVFVVSWVNPDASYSDTGLDDYIGEGYLAAMAEVRRITGAAKVNAVGYCIGGTTLALTVAHLARIKDKTVNSATFFTTLTDFSDPGEVGVFLDDDFVDGIERQVAQDGILDRLFMSRTFSFLRSNDLIWKPAIRSYMLGEAPPAFDLLYWNGDGTDLPGRMAVEYLRGLCQRNEFAGGPGYPVLGALVHLADVRVPVFAVACETDHIAPWKGSFNGLRQMGSADKTLVLAQSGHVAGIVNPPSRGKYGHFTGPAPVTMPEEWQTAATFHEGSWWPRWAEWLAGRSGKRVAARVPEGALAPAPGRYVLAEED